MIEPPEGWKRVSDCVERHLNLKDCSTFLIWTYSQVGYIQLWSRHKRYYHGAMCNAVCPVHTYVHAAYAIRVLWRKQLSHVQFTAMEQEREGESERLGKQQVTTPYRPVNRARLLEAQW